MQALHSAFFHQVSSASRILVPRAWMAKSTMVVVPPKAAARVPVSKSSLDVVPPNGMSRCVWASMPPGSSSMPVASSTCARHRRESGRDFLEWPPSIKTSAAKVFSAVTTVPFLMRIPIWPSASQVFGGKMIFHALHGDAIFHRTDQRSRDCSPRTPVHPHAESVSGAPRSSDAAIQLRNGRHRDPRAAGRFHFGGVAVRRSR